MSVGLSLYWSGVCVWVLGLELEGAAGGNDFRGMGLEFEYGRDGLVSGKIFVSAEENGRQKRAAIKVTTEADQMARGGRTVQVQFLWSQDVFRSSPYPLRE